MKLQAANTHDRKESLRTREAKTWVRVPFLKCPHCEEYAVYRMLKPSDWGFRNYCYTCSYKW